MGNKQLRPLFAALLCLALTTSVRAQADQAMIDSLHQVIENTGGIEKLKAIHRLCYMITNSGSLEEQIANLTLYREEADRQQVLSHQASARAFLLTIYKNAYDSDNFFALLPEALEFFYTHGHGQDNFLMVRYYDTISMANELYLELGQAEMAVRRATELYHQASADKDPYGLSTLSFCLGQGYEMLRQHEKAEDYFRRSVDFGKEIEKEEQRIALLQSAYVTYARGIMNRQKYTQALALCDEWQLAIEEQRAQEMRVLKVLRNTLISQLDCDLLRMRAYAALHCFAQADSCRLLVEEIRQQQDLGPWELPVIEGLFELAYHKENYTEAQPLLDTLIAAFRQYNSAVNVANLLEKQAAINERTGHYQQAAAGYREVLHLQDSIQNAHFTAQLNDLHTIYEVDRITAEKERNRNYFLFSLLGCLLLLIALVIWIIYSRRLRAKNRALYQQIEQQRRQEKERETVAIETTTPAELSKELQLFAAFKELLLKDHLYLSPDLDRHRLISQLGTNERYLIEAVHAGSGMTIGNYISSLRLRYALDLFHEHPELTLEAIALDSGHASYSTFFRAFTRTYGMSPTEYRRLSALSRDLQ